MNRSGKMIMRFARYGLATALVLSAPLLHETSAEAAEPGPDTLPIHVITVQTPDADDQAEALTKALRAAVRAMPGWSQGEGDYSLEVLTLSLKCPDPPDAGCQSRIADQIRADRYIWGVLEKGKKGNVQGELNFWVRGKGTQNYKLDYSANLTESQDEALKKIATEALTKLTGGPPKGEIKVKAGTIPGQVFIDGQPQGALTGGEGTFFIAAGTHELVVKAPGYADMTTSITVKPNSPTDVVLSPVVAENKTPTNWKRIGGFVGVGAGVGFGVVGLVFGSLKVNSLNTDTKYTTVRDQFTEDQDLCTGSPPSGVTSTFTTEFCNDGKTAETMQLVFYPLAAIAAGAGVFLLATSAPSKEKPKTGWTILPQVGRNGAKVDVGFTF